LIEHFAGAFPVWLAPVQAAIIPIADRHIEYAQSVQAKLEAHGLRVEVDDSSDRMQAKIRRNQMQRVPYMLVVGDKEADAGAVAVRLRSNENLGPMPLDRFIDLASQVIDAKSLDLVPASDA
jgi:threonyl-tRNA synthetase